MVEGKRKEKGKTSKRAYEHTITSLREPRLRAARARDRPEAEDAGLHPSFSTPLDERGREQGEALRTPKQAERPSFPSAATPAPPETARITCVRRICPPRASHLDDRRGRGRDTKR